MFSGSKISVEVLGGGVAALNSNPNEVDKLVVDIVVLDNNPSFTSLPNVNAKHYFVGADDQSFDWCTDVVVTKNVEDGFENDRFSWHLLLRLRVGTYAVFAKCSLGTSIRHNSFSLGFNSPTTGVVQNRWFRSQSVFGTRSKVVMETTNNSIRFVGQIGAYLLDGVSPNFNYDPVPWSKSLRTYGTPNIANADGIVINPRYGVIMYSDVQYAGTGDQYDNFTGTNPQYIAFPTNRRNYYSSIRLYYRWFTNEITCADLP